MECVHNARCTAHLYYLFGCFYLYNVHIKECSVDIFDKKFTNVEIQEQTASLKKIVYTLICFSGESQKKEEKLQLK